MSVCCITELDETDPPADEGAGVLWFRCHLDSCHSGIGHIIIKNASRTLYDANPPTTGHKLTWIPLNPSDLAQGGTIDINYDGGGHCCDAAIFDFGYFTDTTTAIGTANLNNGTARFGISKCGHVFTNFTLPPLIIPATPPSPPPGKQVFFNKNYKCPSDSVSATPPSPTICYQVSWSGGPDCCLGGIQADSFKTLTNPFNAIAAVIITGGCDDDLVVNGQVINQDNSAGSVYYTATVAPFASITVGVSNGAGASSYEYNVCFSP